LNIAIDASRTTRAQRTGTENYALQLIRALLALGDPSCTYTLYFRDAPPADLFPSGPSIKAAVIPFPRLWTHLRFATALGRARPTVTFVPAHTLPILFPGRAVVTVHDLGYRYFPQAHTRFSGLYLDWTTRFSALRATHVIADSQATKADLGRFYGIRSEKVSVIYPGVAKMARAGEAQIQAVREKYHLPRRYLLFLGTIQPRKNIARLIEAFQHWRRESGDAEVGLVLAGRTGWLQNDLLLDVPGVCVTGYIADADVAALYSGAAALMFPSLYEGFGFPVVEAMQVGTPVLTSKTSSLPEVAGDAALLVDPLDTAAIAQGIARLVNDTALRADLVARGYRQAAQFTWEAAARATLNVLKKAAG
jgi:glycosyltransferase involved in cell wall biosynthesis